MGFSDLFKKKKHIIEVNGVRVDLDQYYADNWKNFPVGTESTNYILIEFYARYYKDYKRECEYRAKRILEDVMEYSVDISSAGVKIPIKFEDYVGKDNCIQLLLQDIEKCEKVINVVAEKIIEQEKRKKEEKDRIEAERAERERIILAPKVEVSVKAVEFVNQLREFVKSFVSDSEKNREMNSKKYYSYNILSDLDDDTKESTVNMIVGAQMDYEKLVKRDRDILVSKAVLKSGYPKNYVSIVEDILYIVYKYDYNEAFNYKDLDTVVMYVKMHPNDFKKGLVDWALAIRKDLIGSSVKK